MILLTILQIVGILSNVLLMLIIVQFVIGLLFAFNVVSPSNQFAMSVYSSINALLEPLLRPIRRFMPETGSIDFSPLVLIIGLQILELILQNVARSMMV